ncbi:hypothetical protein IQ255_02080 [Pleurocapsales cyanobacterium LEGE 10410]|nr:hypothetical protein [Pleurocapsales cyanobacterium LEGE 10410]
MAKVEGLCAEVASALYTPRPAVHREARFSGIRVAVSYEKSVLPDTQSSPQGRAERLHYFFM